MITLLNSAIITVDGTYMCETITGEKARQLITGDNLWQSAIGHESTAQVLSNLLGIEVPMNRITYRQETGDLAIVFRLVSRAPEGKILTKGEIEALGYEFKLLTRLS